MSQELAHKMGVLLTEFHNFSFDMRNKAGLLDHSLGCYGPIGHRGCKALTQEQYEMSEAERKVSLDAEAMVEIERDISSMRSRLIGLQQDFLGYSFGKPIETVQIKRVKSMRSGIIFRKGSAWMGAHWSPFNKRLCINLIPCVTIWVTFKGGITP